jgi:hypothetical protein
MGRCCNARPKPSAKRDGVTVTAQASDAEARQRDGIGLYVVPLTSRDIDVLVSLRYLREGAEGNRQQVGEAVAAVIRELGRGFMHRDC